MSPRPPILLQDRTVVEVKGPDAATFLQGLITNDVTRAKDGRATYAALLTPQGKVIHDFFVVPVPDGFWLDCVKANAPDLAQRLKKYKLRAKVTITERPDLSVVAAEAQSNDGVTFEDPRLPALGYRVIAAAHAGASSDDTLYQDQRLTLGVPDAASDIPPETLFPLDVNFEELHGVDFDKGCYVGQELTARMKHRATARRRMLPVTADTPLPPPGTPLKLGSSEIGELRGSRGKRGLALVRLDRLGDAQEATADGITVRIGRPAYPLILASGEQQS
jgi:tRNA-modifying protein YgfZ